MPESAAVLEKDWQNTVVAALRTLHWHTNHTRRAIGRGRKWTTPTSAVGFPDLLSVRGPWMLVIELKSDTGVLTPEQAEWLAHFAEIPRSRVWVLRPRDDWPTIQGWLERPEEAPERFGW